MAQTDRIVNWLTRLVSIPSVSPEHVGPRAGTPGEAAMGAHVAAWFESLGGQVYTDEVYPQRSNIIGVWRGRSDRWAGLDVHLDTVGVEQMTDDPFAPRVEGGRVYGRGAVDTKASLGIALALLEELHQSGGQPEVNLVIVGTVDEEMWGAGAAAFANWVRRQHISLETLMVAEPTLCTPVYGHKGASRVEFEVHGRATHSAQPHLGQNAITGAASLILALDAEHRRLQTLPPPTAVGLPTLTVTLIQGGVGLNVVPDSCRLSVDRRVVPGEIASDVTAHLETLARQACPLPVTMRLMREMEAFYSAPDQPWLRQLAAWSGQTPSVAPYGTNAWAYGGLSRECVVMGPGSIDHAHGAVEWVEIAELEKMAGVYRAWWGL